MSLFILLICVLLLVLLISWWKVNAFLAFLLLSITAGLALGMPFTQVVTSVNKGLGDTLGAILVVIVLGAMLGKIIAVSGAARRISMFLQDLFGRRYILWAMTLTGFILGITLYYSVGFMLIIPIVLSVSYYYKLPLIYVGLPILAPLSVMQGLLPPHPAPVILVNQLHADMSLTAVYGLLLSIPISIIAGPGLAKVLMHYKVGSVSAHLVNNEHNGQMPGIFSSLITVLMPVLLMVTASVLSYFTGTHSSMAAFVHVIKEPVLIMLLTLLTATYTLGIRLKKPFTAIMDFYAEAVKDIALILLIIAGAGMLKQVFADSRLNEDVIKLLSGSNLPPLLLAWVVCAFLRLCLGSATVSSLTAAGILYPMFLHSHVNRELLVLAIGSGSLFGSHVNDTGFWLYKEYFNLSVKDTFKTWTLMESLISLLGIGGVLIIDRLV